MYHCTLLPTLPPLTPALSSPPSHLSHLHSPPTLQAHTHLHSSYPPTSHILTFSSHPPTSHAHLQYIPTTSAKEHLSTPDSPHWPHDSHRARTDTPSWRNACSKLRNGWDKLFRRKNLSCDHYFTRYCALTRVTLVSGKSNQVGVSHDGHMTIKVTPSLFFFFFFNFFFYVKQRTETIQCTIQ